ncbi:hypothetical protein B0G76_1366 [Paraburkholderia sp. BL23I1N1]|nr:hypothetical protein B0G76_1366 [Paraburkholderia sp. BL23I1N1]
MFIATALFACFAHATTYSTVDIYMDGDSTMFGWAMSGGTMTCNDGTTTSGCTTNDYGHNMANGTMSQQQHNEPAEVLLDMAAAFGAGTVTVENHGVGGATVLDSINGSADAVSGASEYDCSVTTNESATCGSLGSRLHASHAQIVVGKFLTNDQYRMSPSQFQTYVATWISTVQGNTNADGNPMVAVWEESSPICRLDAPNVGPYLDAGRAAAAAAQPPVLVIDNHDWIYANYDWKPHLSDCVHPDNGLYATLGDRSATTMGRTVQLLLGR